MRFLWNRSFPRCQCRCHGIASNEDVVSVELRRLLSIDRIIPNYCVSHMPGMTLIPEKEKWKCGDRWYRTSKWDEGSSKRKFRFFFVRVAKCVVFSMSFHSKHRTARRFLRLRTKQTKNSNLTILNRSAPPYPTFICSLLISEAEKVYN